jgi:hypothetical protein
MIIQGWYNDILESLSTQLIKNILSSHQKHECCFFSSLTCGRCALVPASFYYDVITAINLSRYVYSYLSGDIVWETYTNAYTQAKRWAFILRQCLDSTFTFKRNSLRLHSHEVLTVPSPRMSRICVYTRSKRWPFLLCECLDSTFTLTRSADRSFSANT